MIILKRLPSRLEIVPELLQECIEQITPLCSPEVIFDIKLSLGEALVNAIKHGNKLNPELSVEIAMEADDRRVVITVKDQGDGFDFNAVDNPTKGRNVQKLSGRGIFLIRSVMDKVEFSNGGRAIIMKKFFAGGGHDGD